uniref:Uncharacterized protein n=1 Tax=Brassica oleracea var. oleracea TaxID=109376 RepID=A0A0D3CRU5_BRAOL
MGLILCRNKETKRKRQNRFDDDERWVRSGDRPFTKAKRSNLDVFDQNELQIYKTKVLSSDKTKAVKPTSKAHSTRCFKCHRIGLYANKGQKQRPLVTLENENVEPEREKEDPLPIFDDFTYEPMKGLDEEKICGHQANKEESSSIQKTDRTQGEHCADYGSFAYNPFPFNVSDLRTNLFETGGNDVPQFVDQSIGADQHGDQDILNNLTEVRSSDRTDQTDRAVPRAS